MVNKYVKNLVLTFVTAICILSCQKTVAPQHYPNDSVLEDRELTVARGKNPHGNPHNISPKKGCMLIDFNGQTITDGTWSVSSVSSSGLTSSEIASVLARVKYDYSFDDSVLITTDESIFNTFPENKRMRCIVTTSWEWYGQVGGVAYLNSFGWYGEKECFVFSSLLGMSEKNVSDAVSHELAHTTGARHHSYWVDCVFVSPYLVGDDLMGNSYAAPNPKFKNAVNDICCTCLEDTKVVIRNAINQ